MSDVARNLQDAWYKANLMRDMERRAEKAQAARPFLRTLHFTDFQRQRYDQRVLAIQLRLDALLARRGRR